ncbi:multidrug efflux RND transporter permease subunit [Xaviernesmea oryzae]|uniref:Efflux pump membrane transporter n=1 Tax=Xaviernesmea oryzae TaxID=464029 RepID=A0A1Q9ATT4_9HYPH|nr:efflux RND transporter permease subunit [Xaviernesmea oryzae]OLP58831.1 multidrug efflux RND transporter permease subunit [Xaviernesmea oryzae]SEM10833.1 multidrug efflux pump [Xaviernesmea oryzae]
MPQYFIVRPVFACVIALAIALAGAIAIPFLPISQYPNVAPPTIAITTSYPGATPENLYDSVTKLIEQEMNGATGMLYYDSVSDAHGSVTINVTFQSGTDPQTATVDVQNRISRVEARLPASVRQQGIRVEETSSAFLLFVGLVSTDGRLNAIDLGEFATRNVIDDLRRLPGVGKAQLFATERAMRVWIDTKKLVGLNLTAQDVTNAIATQNAQVSSGSIGAQPTMRGQEITATVSASGQLSSAKEFAEIVLRANPDGSVVRLSDVARVEFGGQDYSISSSINGREAAMLGVQLNATGNALVTAQAVKTRMAELARNFPAGIAYEIPYDTTPFVSISIEKVIHTLIEAVALVFVIMFLFLQNLRYTLIPTLVVPVALLGTCAALLLFGFSINVLTMFAMVLAIGILVDDAIVVVENVERIMHEEGLPPRQATAKAMKQITGAVVGITVVLIAVFVPMAFFPGAVGIIYKQFSLTIVMSMVFSALMALTLTPALCATILKPIPAGHSQCKIWFFRVFDRVIARTISGYGWIIGATTRRSLRMMALYAAIVIALGYVYIRLPTGFLPLEDQGYAIATTQLPAGATAERTSNVLKKVDGFFLGRSGIEKIVTILGFGFNGNGQNAGISFATFKDWSDRGPSDSSDAIVGSALGTLAGMPEASIFALTPPPIAALGNASGFSFRLQDRANKGNAALVQAANMLLGKAWQSPILQYPYIEGLPPSPQIMLDIDRRKANAYGVSFDEINAVLSTSIGSTYVADYPNAGRMQRVIVQADAPERMNAQSLLALNARNGTGEMVPLSAFTTARWALGPTQVVGYNGLQAVKISGSAAPGHTSGQAMAEMERLAKELPPGFGFEWTGQSYQEKASGNAAPFLLGLSMVFVFLCLAALYESWSIPIAVMLVVPLGAIGAVVAVTFRGIPNDIYFTVGLITIIGLSAKNAILIIEFARDLRAEGKPLLEATVEAAKLRFRPILMTSLAFILGVVPLAFATGASSASQRAIGTGVLGGMVSATVLAVLLVPTFFVVVTKVFARKEEAKPHEPQTVPMEKPAQAA